MVAHDQCIADRQMDGIADGMALSTEQEKPARDHCQLHLEEAVRISGQFALTLIG